MSEPAFLIPASGFRRLSPTAQTEIRALLGCDAPTGLPTASPRHLAPATYEDGGPVDLTVAMVHKLADGLGDKTKAVLRVVATSNYPTFHMRDVISAVDGAETSRDLRAVWAALTRRTRKICDDDEAFLFAWEPETDEYNEAGEYIDHIGYVSDLTHRSLRAYFRVE